jgi:hypothetical protein
VPLIGAHFEISHCLSLILTNSLPSGQTESIEVLTIRVPVVGGHFETVSGVVVVVIVEQLEIFGRLFLILMHSVSGEEPKGALKLRGPVSKVSRHSEILCCLSEIDAAKVSLPPMLGKRKRGFGVPSHRRLPQEPKPI